MVEEVRFYCSAQSKYAPDNEGPQLPVNVEDALWKSVSGAWPNVIYAGFDVCPLNEEKPETMQAACIESAKNIQVKKNDAEDPTLQAIFEINDEIDWRPKYRRSLESLRESILDSFASLARLNDEQIVR